LVITELGIRVFQDGLDDFFLYTEISQITSPECVDRDLDLVLEGDRFDDIRAFSFPVLGVTNDFPDIEVFYEFLLAVLEKLQISPINLRSIRTIDDFIDYLRTECEWETYTEALANYLEREFDPACFDRLKIDKILLDTPDFWRALAVILNIPIRLPLELVRAPDEFDNTAQFKNDEDGG
jgi:hypothetical protein